MKTIQLTQGKSTIVCDCCYHKVSAIKWYAHKDNTTQSFYATSQDKKKPILMHRVINGTPEGLYTDHINGDTLDNRCVNLRTATASQSQMNKGKYSNNKSGYKGVFWNPERQKWIAQIVSNRKQKRLGRFDTPEEAAAAYESAANELHGVFAKH